MWEISAEISKISHAWGEHTEMEERDSDQAS